MSLRPIKAITLPDNAKRATDFGAKPKPLWIAPTSLYVDDEYQRDLNRRSMALIVKIAAGFAWAKLDPPVVVRERGKLHVIDGQHTAIAAATLAVPRILVIEVAAASGFERADEFVCGADGEPESTLLAVARELGPDGLIKCHARATTERISTKVAILDAYRRLARKRKAA